MLTDPLWMQRAEGSPDFGLALRIGSGEILQIWTLFDYHAIPYITVLTQLLPPSIGWPLTLLAPLAVGYALGWGPWPTRALLLWCGIHLFLIGGLKMQHVRYMVPVISFLALCIGTSCDALWQRTKSAPQHWSYGCVLALLIGHLRFYGTAFARIYIEEDSRIQAARFLAKQVPLGSHIGIESGAFSMGPLLGPTHQAVTLGAGSLFYLAPYMLCATQVDFLWSYLRQMDYLTLNDINRAVQFRAVPTLFPVAAYFYEKLNDGHLGFTQIERFREYPRLLGLAFNDEGSEPSFLGYDHPTVLVFRNEGEEEVERAVYHWRRAIAGNSHCADTEMSEVVRSIEQGELERAAAGIEALIKRLPHAQLAYPLAA
ncbi:MAG: hypothetical protein ACKVJG_10595 [Candidatus Latescibacterota bacterium]|jgi:hypothetical protein